MLGFRGAQQKRSCHETENRASSFHRRHAKGHRIDDDRHVQLRAALYAVGMRILGPKILRGRLESVLRSKPLAAVTGGSFFAKTENHPVGVVFCFFVCVLSTLWSRVIFLPCNSGCSPLPRRISWQTLLRSTGCSTCTRRCPSTRTDSLRGPNELR